MKDIRLWILGVPIIAIIELFVFGILSAAGSATILNLNYQWKQLPLPKWLIVVHASAAIAGFVLLLVATWASRPHPAMHCAILRSTCSR